MKVIQIDSLFEKYASYTDAPRLAYAHAERELARELAEIEGGTMVLHCGLVLPTEEDFEYVENTYKPDIYLIGRFPTMRSRSAWVNFPIGSGWRVHAIERPGKPVDTPENFQRDAWKSMCRAYSGPTQQEGYSSITYYPGASPEFLRASPD